MIMLVATTVPGDDEEHAHHLLEELHVAVEGGAGIAHRHEHAAKRRLGGASTNMRWVQVY